MLVMGAWLLLVLRGRRPRRATDDPEKLPPSPDKVRACRCYYYCYQYYWTLFLPRGKVRPADKLQLKAATILPLDGLARSKQAPVKRGHGAQYLYRPPQAGAKPAPAAVQYENW